jgi:hypothetical protein
MSDPRPFVVRKPSRRRAARRAGPADRRADGDGQNLPVVIAAPCGLKADPGLPAPSAKPGAAAFSAQILGQDGQKRGLRGGPETLQKARNTYLGAEWSGLADRRPKAGRITKTEI